MRKSANQHFDAGTALDASNKKAVAAYLFGLAAECAVKAIMLHCGIPGTEDRDSAYFAHFPVLRTKLQTLAQGRKNFDDLRFAQKDTFLADWDITIRYAASADIFSLANRYERWVESATTAIQQMSKT